LTPSLRFLPSGAGTPREPGPESSEGPAARARDLPVCVVGSGNAPFQPRQSPLLGGIWQSGADRRPTESSRSGSQAPWRSARLVPRGAPMAPLNPWVMSPITSHAPNSVVRCAWQVQIGCERVRAPLCNPLPMRRRDPAGVPTGRRVVPQKWNRALVGLNSEAVRRSGG
jgi:hypothetical protein